MAVRLVQMMADEAQPGMALGADVRDSAGHVLLSAGVELTETLLATLRRRGVERLMIAVEDQRSAQEIAAQRAQIGARLEHLFRNAGADALLAELRRVVLEYRSETLP